MIKFGDYTPEQVIETKGEKLLEFDLKSADLEAMDIEYLDRESKNLNGKVRMDFESTVHSAFIEREVSLGGEEETIRHSFELQKSGTVSISRPTWVQEEF